MKRISAAVLAMGLLVGLASGPLAQPARAASLKICGEVTAFVEPTLLGTGLLTINAIPLVVAANVDLPASVDVGADVCLDITTNALGMVTGVNVSANAHTHLKLCGTVNAYAEATASAAGSIRIGSRTLAIGQGSDLPASVDVGDNLCLDFELDGFGRVSDGEVSANATSHVKICGVVTALAEATAMSTGSLTIGGQTFKVAPDEDLPASVDVGSDLCLDLTINGFGHITGTDVEANIETTLDVCGKVTAFADATSTTNGSLTIAGVTRPIAAGADVDADVEANAYLKLRLKIDAFSRIAEAIVLDVGTSVDDVCGTGPAPTGLPIPTIVIPIPTIVIPIPSLLPGGPSDDPGPNPTPGPIGSPDPTASPDPSFLPGMVPSPAPSEPPDVAAAPNAPSGCVEGFVPADGAQTGTLLPDTVAMGRAAGVVATNAIPLLALGLLGGFAAWYRTRRNRDVQRETDGAVIMRDVKAVDTDRSTTDTDAVATPADTDRVTR